jgi:nucleoid-associated protein YgaU
MGLFDFFKDAGEAIANAIGISDAHASDDIKAKIAAYNFDIKDLEVSVEGEKVTLRGTAADAHIAEKAILTAGNIKGVSKVESHITVADNAEFSPVFYTVKSGDTLSKIAKHYYGDANQYNKIFEANKPMLSHADKIYPGQNLRIPDAAGAKVAA